VHGLRAFLEAMAEPRVRQLPIDIVIIGDGQYRTECERVVQMHNLENVSILPAIPLDQVSGALAQADVLVCTFRNGDDIPLCSKLYEYCAAGKPVLVYGTNVAGDLVAHIGNGLACPAGDADLLLGVLSDFLARPEVWRCRGQQGRAYALEHFSQVLRDQQWEQILTYEVRQTGGT
jgi:glycosyltransferase involved in cell wall biosynthesis